MMAKAPALDTEEQVGACTACRADYLALNHFYREKIFQTASASTSST